VVSQSNQKFQQMMDESKIKKLVKKKLPSPKTLREDLSLVG
jgi:hypothetical protein